MCPGIDYDNLTPELVTSLAVVTAATTGRVRWSGVKLHAGTALARAGHDGNAFRPARRRRRQMGRSSCSIRSAATPTEAPQLRRWCHARGMRVKVHTGGVSRSGASVVCGYDVLSWLQPDIAAHVSGGPIPMSDEDIDSRGRPRPRFALEVCSSGQLPLDRAPRRGA